MARVPLARLLTLQQQRHNEIEAIGARMRERDPDTLAKNMIEARMRTLEERWEDIRRVHDEIAVRADAARHQYMVENRFEAMNRVYEDTLDLLLNALANFPTARERNPQRRAREDDDEDDLPAKLPRIDLPTFSGKYEDWDSFEDVFTSLVHDAPRIKDVTKLQYLKSCLKGTAAELVKDVTLLGVNYASTWKALRDRFRNPRLAVKKLFESLRNVPFLKKESAVELRALVDEAQRIVRALSNLKAPVTHWDMWLVDTLEIRIDSESRKLWESELIAKDRQLSLNAVGNETDDAARFPKFVDLIAFLEQRAQSLAVVSSADKDNKRATPSTSGNSKKVHHTNSSPPAKASKCALCSGDHFIAKCPTFTGKNASQCQNDVRHLRLCFNCLGRHKLKDCKSSYTCRYCREKHHSLLHKGRKGNNSGAAPKDSKPDASALQVQSCVAQMSAKTGLSVNACNASADKNQCSILLATAQVIVVGPNGKETRARALLDQGSEATFISESLVQMLGLHRDRVETTITGIGGCKAGTIKHATSFMLKSRIESNFEIEINAFVMPRLTSELPSRNIFELDLGIFNNLALADPEFNCTDKVDIMVGADVYGQLLRSGLKTFSTTLLVAQNTALGWIVSGPTQTREARRAVHCNRTSVKALRCAVNDDLTEALQRFWTVEEVPSAAHKLKPEDEACEKLFAETHTRETSGHYKVRLPLISEPPRVAAETRRMALGSLKHQQRRFERDSKLAYAYRDFMQTYERLGHMERIPGAELSNPRAWYLPHHAVITGAGEKSKIRVVFDASRKTHEKHCLNEFLMAGPPLQTDLLLVLLNWRRYRYAFTADIVKMFRQIVLDREDQDLHRIVWSPSSDIPVADYRLTTVTYGTTSAPFLAIRTLMQLARDERARFPRGAACLESNTYVDDMFAGADELAEAVLIRQELVSILRSAGIELDKWAANESTLLPASAQSSNNGVVKEIESDSSVKTLGVHWNPLTDKFSFTAAKTDESASTLTKRSIYSNIARLFDPLGWLAPVTVTAKIIMQDIWIEKCEWDTPLPGFLSEQWREYCRSLADLPHVFAMLPCVRTPRRFTYVLTPATAHIIRPCYVPKRKRLSIQTISVPKLELLAAVLLVKLVRHVQNLEFLKDAPVRLFGDSEIVQHWLKKHPCNWKTFVANRVSLIQTELPSATWSHVISGENPADLATRGVTPNQLKSANLWWQGPGWLAKHSQEWPQSLRSKAKSKVQALHVKPRVLEPEILSRYSKMKRLTRVVAWCLRPSLQRTRRMAGQGSYPSTWLTVAELDNARSMLIKLAQAHAFPAELDTLRRGRALPIRHPLRSLNPFLDYDDILRVGGRLSNANLPYHLIYPPILSRTSALSKLFVEDAHEKALHGGPTLTISFLLRNVWIVGMRPLVKTAVRKCVTCQRHKPRLAHQLMGDLPAARVTPNGTFATTGLDYAGPFQLRASKGRGQVSYKGYIALFVCLNTKAIHLEPVGDLTSATFIMALRRFINAKGDCKHLYSDNATTFRGADTELRAMFQDASAFYEDIAPKLADEGISWTFIPPNTPHYGGIWEAGVKSTKNLLKKTIGEHKLTFEEFATVLSDIATCLNSRPLRPYTSDPEDLRALTPAHFLRERPSVIIPDAEAPDVPINRLDRFQLLQRLRDQFWKRWSSEYVLQLQERKKWLNPTDNFKVGQLVLIKDDRYPAAKWPLGRVIEVHPGQDDLVRVVTVKTASNTLRRHVACLAPLDLDQPEDKDE